MHLRVSDTNGSTNNYDVDLLETLVYEWIRRSIYFKHFRLSNTIIKSIALRFKAILNLNSFTANKEWLQKFRITYNLRDVHTTQMSDIGYKINKSTLPADIFNELQPKWASLDPTSVRRQKDSITGSDRRKSLHSNEVETNVQNEKICDLNRNNKTEELMEVQDIALREIETNQIHENNATHSSNSIEFFDIEDELPVCTIFGRKTVENVANIISSNQNSKEETFQPMIVCTDPKNPNLNAIHRTTTETNIFKSINIPEVEKIKDLISGKTVDSESNTLNQNEYIDQYLKEIVRVPDDDTIIYKGSSSQPTPEKKCETQIFKPISMPKLRVKKLGAKKTKTKTPVTNVELPSNQSLESNDIDSNKELPAQPTKPNLKRKVKQNSAELSNCINLETITIDETPALKQPTLDSLLSSVESTPTNLQTEITNQIPTIVQQAWDPTLAANLVTSNTPGEAALATQSYDVGPERITYTLQLSAPNQNQLAIPFISPMSTNALTYQFGQPTTLQPIILHFNSPITGSDVINLAQIPAMSQTSFIPSIDLTQQPTTPTNITNLIQNQFIQPITTHVQQISTTQTPTIVATSNKSSTSTIQSSTFGATASNSTLTTTHVPTIVKPLKIKAPASLKTQTITSYAKNSLLPTTTTTGSIQLPQSTNSPATSDLVPATPTTALPDFLAVQTRPTTIKRVQLPESTRTPTIITSPTSNSSLTASSAVARIQLPTSIKTSTVTSSTSNSPHTTPSACFSNFVPAKITTTTELPIQTPTSLKSPINALSQIPSSITTAPKISKPVTNLISNSKTTATQMQVTITKQSKLEGTAASLNNGTRFAQRAPLRKQEEVIKCIKLMEEFAMMNENFRLIGFLERLEKQICINNKS